MSKILDIDFRTGSLTEKVTGYVPTSPEGLPYLVKSSKGYGVQFKSNYDSLGYYPIEYSDNDFTVVLGFETFYNHLHKTQEDLINTGFRTFQLLYLIKNGRINLYINGLQYNIYGIGYGNLYFLFIKREGNNLYVKINDGDFIYKGTISGGISTGIFRVGRTYGYNNSLHSSIIYSTSVYNNALSQQEANKLYKDFLNSSALAAIKFNYLKAPDYENGDITFYDDFHYEKADGQEQVPKDWLKGTGTFKFTELTADDPVLTHLKKGQKVLECITAGRLAIPFKGNIGMFEFDFKIASGYVGIITQAEIFTDTSPLSYSSVNIGSNIQAFNQVGPVHFLFSSISNYIDVDTIYRIKIDRERDFYNSISNIYIKGGSIGKEYVLVSASIGNNPYSDIITTNNEVIFDIGAGTQISNVKITNNE